MSTEASPGEGLAARVAAELEAEGGTVRREFDQLHVLLPAARITESVRHAKTAGFEQISDVMGIDWLDYPGHQGPRFTVVYNLYSLTQNERLMLRVNVRDDEHVPTITGLWRAAKFMEREVYDMFGIPFDGHPDLRKLLTPEDLDGHAHRKDFPLGETPTLFNEGRFLDPESFRAGMIGRQGGLTGWAGGARKGVRSDPDLEHPEGGEG
ncbi:MAG: NADH-quinone oxidoreductase subunit C [Trueperaceae bacterium]|nr:NADH-quinone oxidoreductase subunit C [Trueperaceae bacterium]